LDQIILLIPIKYFVRNADIFDMPKGRLPVENIVTAEELGEYLKLSKSTMYKLAAKGDFPGFKIGDSWRFDMDDIIEFIKDAKNNKTRNGGPTEGRK